MKSERIGGGLGDSLGMSLKYFAQKETTNIILAQGVQISNEDRAILRQAASELAELAARPCESEKKRLWYNHNSLKSERPLVVCDPENGWYEIITPDRLKCSGDLARVMEFQLRKDIYWAKEMGDDKVATAIYRTHHIFTETSRGFDKKDVGTGTTGSYVWKPALDSPEDVEMLQASKFRIYDELTALFYETAKDIFCGFLEVRQETMWWNSFGLTSDLIFLIGMENMLMDMIDEPEKIHAIMAFLRDEMLGKFAFAEESGLLCANNNDMYVGTGGYGWTHELPSDDFSGTARLKDIWGLGESQETIGISPEMFAEFVLPYQMPLLEKFGLNCYGCCEPLDARWKYIKDIPRLRRLSVSAWANESALCEAMGNRYIYSRKPPSSWLAAPVANEDVMRKGLENTILLAKDCNLELIMKDNHTIGNNPQNCIKYVSLCRELIERHC